MTSEFAHTPVLLSETLALLDPTPGGRYVDATVGGGGHAEKILELSSPTGALLGLDADPSALAAAGERLRRFGDRVLLREAFDDGLLAVARETDFTGAHGVLFDLGVSSPQLDRAERGFSFSRDAPLDMRLGPGAGITAADLIATSSAGELQRIFSEYGEERYSGRIARRIVRERAQHPIRSTTQLADLVVSAVPPSRERIHPATRVFQALRIAVNDELGRLRAALPQALETLTVGGRLAVITFHSLEDRIVKQFMQLEARGCICPPEVPQCVCGHQARLRLLTRRPTVAGEEEVRANPRARSAKLRVAEKIAS